MFNNSTCNLIFTSSYALLAFQLTRDGKYLSVCMLCPRDNNTCILWSMNLKSISCFRKKKPKTIWMKLVRWINHRFFSADPMGSWWCICPCTPPSLLTANTTSIGRTCLRYARCWLQCTKKQYEVNKPLFVDFLFIKIVSRCQKGAVWVDYTHNNPIPCLWPQVSEESVLTKSVKKP